MLSAREKLAAAIMRVVEPPVGKAPYFGAVLRGLIRRETPGLGTIGVTNRGVMMWDAAFVEKVNVEELAIVLMHEVMHVVLKHFDRFIAMGIVPKPTADMAEDAFRANIAGDLAINQELAKLGPIPADVVTPESLGLPDGLLMEEYYRLLQQKQQQQKSGGGGPEGESDNKPGVGKGKPGVGKGWCGSCAAHPLPQEPEAGKDEEGRSEADMERYRKQVAEDVKEHVEKKRGFVPGSLQRWAEEYLSPPKIDWRTKLARVLRAAVAHKSGSVDFTWAKMSRRQAGVGFGIGRPVIPAIHAPIPSCAVGVDTSGSMSALDLSMALSEIQGVLAAVGASVTVLACDAEVHAVKECRTVNEAATLLVGGGGTSMLPIFEELEKRKNRPSVTIITTDGHIGDGYPAVEPSWTKVIWCVIGVGGNVNCCPYGEIVHIT